jgi:hypothetical protein
MRGIFVLLKNRTGFLAFVHFAHEEGLTFHTCSLEACGSTLKTQFDSGIGNGEDAPPVITPSDDPLQQTPRYLLFKCTKVKG